MRSLNTHVVNKSPRFCTRQNLESPEFKNPVPTISYQTQLQQAVNAQVFNLSNSFEYITEYTHSIVLRRKEEKKWDKASSDCKQTYATPLRSRICLYNI